MQTKVRNLSSGVQLSSDNQHIEKWTLVLDFQATIYQVFRILNADSYTLALSLSSFQQ